MCLRSIEWSETSQIVVLLTREWGKVRGLAKGSKRLSPSAVARFSGGIELLQRGEVLATTKATAELANVTEWNLADDHHHLRRSLAAQRLAMYAAELADDVLPELDPHPASFDALTRFLKALADPARLRQAALRFQWAVIVDAGFKPELDADVHDGAALVLDTDREDAGEPVAFDPLAGGLTRRTGPGQWKTRTRTAALLRRLAAGDQPALAAADPDSIDRANRLLCSYLRETLGRELATMRFILNSGGVA